MVPLGLLTDLYFLELEKGGAPGLRFMINAGVGF